MTDRLEATVIRFSDAPSVRFSDAGTVRAIDRSNLRGTECVGHCWGHPFPSLDPVRGRGVELDLAGGPAP